MTRACDLLGTGPLVGNQVSHSNIKTKRRFLPNLCNVTLFSDMLGYKIRLRISAQTLRTVDVKGGLDKYLLSLSPAKLTLQAQQLRKKIKNQILQKQTV
jgi:large subunit ribosomal protein L28